MMLHPTEPQWPRGSTLKCIQISSLLLTSPLLFYSSHHDFFHRLWQKLFIRLSLLPLLPHIISFHLQSSVIFKKCQIMSPAQHSPVASHPTYKEMQFLTVVPRLTPSCSDVILIPKHSLSSKPLGSEYSKLITAFVSILCCLLSQRCSSLRYLKVFRSHHSRLFKTVLRGFP